MTEADIADIAAWLADAGLQGGSESDFLEGFCARATAAGLAVARGVAYMDTLHPVHEGRVSRWVRGSGPAEMTEYARGASQQPQEGWLASPAYHLLTIGERWLRRRLELGAEREFPVFAELREAGYTDYVAIVDRFGERGAIGEMDCFYSHWTSAEPEGFREDDVRALLRLSPFLGLAIKTAGLARIAETLVETYLGRDAGRRVLSGRIERGVADRIEAALWFSDLRNYTRISAASRPEDVIPLLNDYAEAVISAVHGHGGDVLKLIGDGVLAIFAPGDRAQACAMALAAAEEASASVSKLSARRREEGRAATDMYLGLHFGEAYYGNIGAKDRLDFTVVGPAVNEVSRIAAMCRSVDQPLLMSEEFTCSVAQTGRRFASVGRFALRGVDGSQELFTLDNFA